jgi:hypothetical protein
VSTAAAASPEGAGFTAWWAHHERWWWRMYLVIGVLSIALRLLGINGGAFSAIIIVVIVFVVFMNLKALGGHLMRLCAVCLDRMPADGQRIAEKKKSTLANYHRTHSLKASLIALVPIIGLPIFFPDNNIYQAACTALIWGWFSYTSYLDCFHRPLVPFCPYCDWGGGDGPHEQVPNPDPSMIKTA